MVRLLRSWPKNDKRLNFELFESSFSEYRRIFPHKQSISCFSELSPESIFKLQSALGAVSFESSEGFQYQPGIEAASAYLFFINHSHFLVNGNKRASLYGTLGYLYLNNHFLKTSWEKLYRVAEKIAQFSRKEDIWNTILNFIDGSICVYKEDIFQDLIHSATKWVSKHPEIY